MVDPTNLAVTSGVGVSVIVAVAVLRSQGADRDKRLDKLERDLEGAHKVLHDTKTEIRQEFHRKGNETQQRILEDSLKRQEFESRLKALEDRKG